MQKNWISVKYLWEVLLAHSTKSNRNITKPHRSDTDNRHGADRG